MQVAANYDGAGKVVVITGANSGIGKSQPNCTQTAI
jgi:NADP-dependent 3-hydroxy acid dehydrogenase YdfG